MKRTALAGATLALLATAGVLAASSFGSAGPSTKAQGGPEFDHYLCYKALAKTPQRVAFLIDQFGREGTIIQQTSMFCPPVKKDLDGKPGAGILNPVDHLRCYALTEVPGDQFTPRRVRVDNQFGVAFLDVVRVEQLCVPTLKSFEPIPTSTKYGPQIDHFLCYLVKPVGQTPPKRVILTDQFGAGAGEVRQAVTLCNPVQKVVKSNADTGPPPLQNEVAHLVCYEVKTTKKPRPLVYGLNQLDNGQIRLRLAVRLCVPSFKQELRD
jgi:hypothetical protein